MQMYKKKKLNSIAAIAFLSLIAVVFFFSVLQRNPTHHLRGDCGLNEWQYHF